jgi:hypothetical protein
MTLAGPLTQPDVNLMKRLEVSEYLSNKPTIVVTELKPQKRESVFTQEDNTMDRTDARILSELFPDRSLTTQALV